MAEIEIRPVTPERWADVERLAGDRGFSSGCWCMWWRLANKEFLEATPAEKRAALEAIVADGREPGLLAYADGEPVGWAAIAPREEYRRIERSRKLRPIDEQPAWGMPCFYVRPDQRRNGVAEALLDAAVDHAAARGADLVEGYPIDTAAAKKASADLYTGTLPMFERAGFTEVSRQGGRPIVRKELGRSPATAVHHITLRVSDLERARAFYQGVLGLALDQALPGKYRFRLGPTRAATRLVLVAALPGTPPDDRFDERRIGLHHVALAVDHEAELDDLVVALSEAAVPTQGVQHVPGGGTLVCFRDPDNIQWEFFAN